MNFHPHPSHKHDSPHPVFHVHEDEHEDVVPSKSINQTALASILDDHLSLSGSHFYQQQHSQQQQQQHHHQHQQIPQHPQNSQNSQQQVATPSSSDSSSSSNATSAHAPNARLASDTTMQVLLSNDSNVAHDHPAGHPAGHRTVSSSALPIHVKHEDLNNQPLQPFPSASSTNANQVQQNNFSNSASNNPASGHANFSNPANNNSHNNFSNNTSGHANANAIFQSAFPFHNPFDINSYPMTNPPIFDSTMMIPYTTADGIPRRRRISISNGQIGQIINHEVFSDSENSTGPFDDFIPSQPQPQPQPQSQPQHYSNTNEGINNVIMGNYSQVPAHPAQPAQQHDLNSASSLRAPATSQSQSQQQPSQQSHKSSMVMQSQIQPQSQPVPPPPANNVAPAPESISGVPPPNHQLIYNNEVIYNPHAGPIPGTAAWKKERLLERNRIAASKCRQRKKHAQQQLQDNISRYENKITSQQRKLMKFESVCKQYNAYLQNVMAANGGQIDDRLYKFKKFIESGNIDDVDDDEVF